MKELLPQKLCCGCEACLNSCAKKAIYIYNDKYGFRYPAIDTKKCIECGACKSVCPVIQQQNNIESNFRYYAGSRCETNKLINSASGGAATVISEAFIRNKGFVAGVQYSNGYTSAEYKLVDKVESLNLFLSSKYIQSKKNSIYCEINKKIHEKKRVLFIGLPCDVQAMKLFTRNNDLLYTIALVCHGPTSPEVGRQYIEFMKKLQNSTIEEFNVRSKLRGWENPHLYIKFSNGKEYKKPFYSTAYGLGFSMLQRTCCYNCKFKLENINADLILGDCWGLSKDHKSFNKDGISLVITKTKKGVDLLSIAQDFTYSQIDFDDINVPATNIKFSKQFQQKDYERFFLKKGVIGAYKKMNSFGYKFKYHLIHSIKKCKKGVNTNDTIQR